MSESKNEGTFKVVDRRLFTEDGELRKEVAEQQDREREIAPRPSVPTTADADAKPGILTPESAPNAPTNGTQPAKETAKRSPAFENLIRSLGQNAAMLLGGYADPRSGQPMLDLEGAREMIDMLDALREKTIGNLAPEEDTLVIDILGNLKLAYMEMTQAAAAAVQTKAKTRP